MSKVVISSRTDAWIPNFESVFLMLCFRHSTLVPATFVLDTSPFIKTNDKKGKTSGLSCLEKAPDFSVCS